MKDKLEIKSFSREGRYNVVLFNNKFIVSDVTILHHPKSRYEFMHEYFGNYFESLEEAENRAKFLEKEYKKWKRRKNG